MCTLIKWKKGKQSNLLLLCFCLIVFSSLMAEGSAPSDSNRELLLCKVANNIKRGRYSAALNILNKSTASTLLSDKLITDLKSLKNADKTVLKEMQKNLGKITQFMIKGEKTKCKIVMVQKGKIYIKETKKEVKIKKICLYDINAYDLKKYCGSLSSNVKNLYCGVHALKRNRKNTAKKFFTKVEQFSSYLTASKTNAEFASHSNIHSLSAESSKFQEAVLKKNCIPHEAVTEPSEETAPIALNNKSHFKKEYSKALRLLKAWAIWYSDKEKDPAYIPEFPTDFPVSVSLQSRINNDLYTPGTLDLNPSVDKSQHEIWRKEDEKNFWRLLSKHSKTEHFKQSPLYKAYL